MNFVEDEDFYILINRMEASRHRADVAFVTPMAVRVFVENVIKGFESGLRLVLIASRASPLTQRMDWLFLQSRRASFVQTPSGVQDKI